MKRSKGKKKYLFKFNVSVKSPVYIRANGVREAENKLANKNLTLMIKDINRKLVGKHKKWEL